MDKVLQKVIELKVPSLILIAILFYFGADLIKASNDFSSISGYVGIALIFLGVYILSQSFNGYKKREEVSELIDQQSKVIKTLSESHFRSSETSAIREKTFQDSINKDTVGDKEKSYSVESSGHTDVG